MFEVGFTEIVLILGIALLVLGPERLPKLAADLGRWAGRARAMARQLRTQLEQEVNYDPLRDTPKPSGTIHTPPPSAPEADKTGATPETQAADEPGRKPEAQAAEQPAPKPETHAAGQPASAPGTTRGEPEEKNEPKSA